MGTICIIATHYARTKKLFGAQTGFFEELSTMAMKDGHQIFIVDVDQFTKYSKPIKGFTFDLNHNCWKYIDCKRPFVLYDRSFPDINTYTENLPFPEIIERNFTIFNPIKATAIMNDKYQSLKLLEQSGISFPKTELIDSNVYDSELLKTKNRFVIKPRFGMKGNDVCFAEKRGLSLELNNTGEIVKIEHLHERFKGYVIQEQIDTLFSSNGKSADFRVLLQRIDGKIQAVGSYARTGDKNLPLNLACGGRIVSIEKWLYNTAFTHEKIEQTKEALNTVALEAGNFLCSRINGIFEIGMDFILDEDNKLWCLEANSKPARLGFKLLAMDKTTPLESQKYFTDVREQSMRNIIKFGQDLLSRLSSTIKLIQIQ